MCCFVFLLKNENFFNFKIIHFGGTNNQMQQDLNFKKINNENQNGEEFKLIKLEKSDLSSRSFFVLKTANLESLLLAYKECMDDIQ